MQSTGRSVELRRLYEILDRLMERIGAPIRLGDADVSKIKAKRGVYFFFEPGEKRSGSGSGLRVVRVGTHALARGSRSTLRDRLAQHRGTLRKPGGNHRGSIFRLLIGAALIEREPTLYRRTWGHGSSAPSEVRAMERTLEARVSTYIGAMPFLWLSVDDEPGPESLRGYIERNSIAVLSDWNKQALDPPSAAWLGRDCPRERICGSGLWNSNHVNEFHDRRFLDVLSDLVQAM